jgi:AcrR family transcriptional regulator
MDQVDVAATELQLRLRALRAPRPILSRDDLARLTDRQRELLVQLGPLFAQGFGDLTMAEIASELGCSLRTLYGVAPSRDDLVLAVLDTHLWRIGREAMGTLDPDAPPLDALRTYLSAATVAVAGTTAAYARDLGSMAAAQRRNQEHASYVVAVVQALLDWAIERGDIAPVDSAAVARTLATLGQDFVRPEVLTTLRSTPKAAADELVDIILRGLPRPGTPHPAPEST